MAQTISSYQLAAFSVPVNGAPGDADQVRGNDNSLRSNLNSHDADAGIHLQSSTLANRPAAGTLGRKWFTSDEFRLYFDDGAAWQETAYVPVNNPSFTGLVSITSTFQTASTNPLAFGTNSVIRWNISGTTGHFLSQSNNTYDIGSTTAAPRSIYAATSGIFGAGTITVTVSGNAITATGGDLSIIAPVSQGIVLSSGNTARWTISPTGNLLGFANNAYDIGDAAAAGRPKNIYFAGLVQGPLYRDGAGLQILTSRQVGWAAATGTATRTAFATSTVSLSVLAEHVKALTDDLITHGVIGP